MSKLRGNPWAVLVVVSLGFFMTLLDLTIVNIAIPNMIDRLHASLDDVMTTIDYHGAPAESLAGFGKGERVTVRDLLRALLITSANDAAATLAQRIGGTRAKFVAMMNAKAREIGLPIAIVNRGRTRGDELADLKLEGDVGVVLGALVETAR